LCERQLFFAIGVTYSPLFALCVRWFFVFVFFVRTIWAHNYPSDLLATGGLLVSSGGAGASQVVLK
jgi:hypothetical protein